MHHITYPTTITRKGQVVVPKKVRDILRIRPHQRLVFEVDARAREATLRPIETILDLAGTYKPKKIVSALRLREKFEKEYERF